MTTRELVRDGVRISYRTEGSGGPTVLLLPAFQIIDSRMWDGQMSELAGVARVVSYDLAAAADRASRSTPRPTRSPSCSPTPSPCWTPPADQTPAVLVGNSLGGALAYLLAALHPDRVAGIALLAPTVNITGDAGAPLVAAGLRFERGPRRAGPRLGPVQPARLAARLRRVRRVVHPHRLTRTARRGDPATGGVVGHGEQRRPARGYCRDAGREPPDEQARTFRALAGAVRCPALVVHGERDEIVPGGVGPRGRPGARRDFVAHPDAGHCPHLSYPAMVNSVLRDFLASVTGERSAA